MTESRLELLYSDHGHRYLLDSPAEIRGYLQRLCDRGILLSLHADDQPIARPAVLLAVTDDDIILDCDAITAGILTQGHLVIGTALDRVQIQFDARRPRATTFTGRPALAADFPIAMLRLQRRSFFRLTAPTQPPLHCRLALDEDRSQWLETRILDLSVGGLAVVAAPANHPFEVNQHFPSCRLALPGGSIDAGLRVRNLFLITLPGAGKVLRAGCQFESLNNAMGNLLQRYVLDIERSRRARRAPTPSPR